jgi:S-DNA-T family DNA segregation ATPase FtsK/SpoIIIE
MTTTNPTTTGPTTGATTGVGAGVPVGPILSIFDPVYLGINEYAEPVYVTLIYRNMLIGGEPGGGKSTLLSNIIAHAALSTDVRLCLLDGKYVELGMWAQVADVFVGPDMTKAIRTLRRLQTVMDNRYTYLLSGGQRKIAAGHAMKAILLAIDEVAYFSATVGSRDEQDTFSALLRDLVARGRAVGIIVVAATQRPSFDIIPTSLRDLFSWRFATRCTTEASSDIILGRGWAEQGYNAQHIAPEDLGVGLLLAEGGTPRLVRGAYLSDQDITRVATFAAWTRHHRHHPNDHGAPARTRRPSPHPAATGGGIHHQPARTPAELAEVTP